MINRKDFTVPFWLLMPLIIIQVFALYFFIRMAAHSLQAEKEFERKYVPAINSESYPAPRTSRKFISESIRAGITILILVGESIILWRIRKKKYNRWLAIGYVLPLVLILAVFPIMALRIGVLFDWLVPNDTLYWTSISIAHLSLAIIVWQSRRKKVFMHNDPANILDDYAGMN